MDTEMTMGEPVLSVRDLATGFPVRGGMVMAVDGVSFDVHAGRTLCIVGESGCGKSVTARSILRIIDRPGKLLAGSMLLRRPEGEIDLAALPQNGRELRAIRGGEIGLIFQEPMTSFSNYYTIGNQIGEMLRLHLKLGKREARQRAIELLARVGVPNPERRVDEFPFQLSGGLRQRVMIAMALSCEPRLLIADEPTTALDVTTQAQILDLLVGIQQREHMAMMLITHDMGVVAEVADDVAVMYLGRLVESGPVDEIFHAPRHPYTQALLRSIPSIRAVPRSRLPVLAGSVPSTTQRPVGCPFHPRCGQAMAGLCNVQTPALKPVGAGHEVSCFLHDPAVVKPVSAPAGVA
jgi:oligopeptide/dipeptide ABC transporter ATP-binding protein